VRLDCDLFLDLLIEDKVVVELKSVEEIVGIHEAQLLTYLKLSEKRVGLLINFNSEILKDGIRRRVL
jgi:GxxExxY protein